MSNFSTLFSVSFFFLIFFSCFPNIIQASDDCKVKSDCDFGEICQDDICSNCEDDSDCSQEQVCNSSDECVHKDLFEPFDGFDVLLLFIIAIGSALNASVGIGGGTLYMPLLLLLFFQDAEAVTLSNAMTTTAALAQVLINIRSKSPISHKPLIDFDIALIVSPLSTGGTIIGMFIYHALPPIILRFGLILFLVVLNIRIAKKARGELKAFQVKNQKVAKGGPNGEYAQIRDYEVQSVVSPSSTTQLEESPLIQPTNRKKNYNTGTNNSAPPQNSKNNYEIVEGATSNEMFYKKWEEFSAELKEMIKTESTIPFDKILIICILFTILSTFSFTLKQDNWWESVEYCGVGYWFIVLLLLPFLATFAFFIARYFNLRHEKREALNYPFPDSEIRWTFQKVISVALFSLMAGAAAALFGIGGGVLYVPMMMELGVHPEVYSATSGFLIVLTSLSSFLTHSFDGHILIEYTIFFAAASFSAAFVGVRVIKYALKKSGKSYLVLLVLNAALTLSALALFIYTMVDMANNFEKGSNPFENTGSIC